ncbi:MAG: arginase family protein [Candidatus Dormibacteraceae bacterium]
MELHVVELPAAHTGAGFTPTPESDAYRREGVYEAGGATLTFGRPDFEGIAVGDPIAALALMSGRIAAEVADGMRAGRDLLMVGGNCTSVPGLVGGLQQALGPTTRIGLVWFDAHGDFNTPRTTPSGMLGGMPVAVAAGLCHPSWRAGAGQLVPLSTDRIVMVDVRNLDDDEARLIRATDVTTVPIRGPQLKEALERLVAETDLLYLHIDLDVLDAALVPSHRTLEADGPDVAETAAALSMVLGTGRVRALALVSVCSAEPGGDVSLASATALLRACLRSWAAA